MQSEVALWGIIDDRDRLEDAVKLHKTSTAPIQLIQD